MDLKVCTTCHGAYPLDSFYKNDNNKGGRAHKCPTCSKEYARQNRINNHFKVYAKKYKTTPEIIETVLSQIVCEICQAHPKPDQRNFIDHCHTTGVIRGLLCDDCNMGLGRFKDSTERLKKAIQYLEKEQDGV